MDFYEDMHSPRTGSTEAEPGDSSSNQSDVPVDVSSTERLYKDKNKNKVDSDRIFYVRVESRCKSCVTGS